MNVLWRCVHGKGRAAVALRWLVAGVLVLTAGCDGDVLLHERPYDGAVVVERVAPDTIAPEGVVTIRGANFSAVPENNTVLFVPGTRGWVLAADHAELRVIPPPDAQSGPVLVRVGRRSGISADSIVIDTTKPSAMRVMSFQPTTVRPGTRVEIYGWGFSPLPGEQTVWFGDRQAIVEEATAGRVVAVVPEGVQPGSIRVVRGGRSAGSREPYVVLAATPPRYCRIRMSRIDLALESWEYCTSPSPAGCREDDRFFHKSALVINQVFEYRNDSTYVYRDEMEHILTVRRGGTELDINYLTGTGRLSLVHCGDVDYRMYLDVRNLRTVQTAVNRFEVPLAAWREAAPAFLFRDGEHWVRYGSCGCTCWLSNTKVTYPDGMYMTVEFF